MPNNKARRLLQRLRDFVSAPEGNLLPSGSDSFDPWRYLSHFTIQTKSGELMKLTRANLKPAQVDYVDRLVELRTQHLPVRMINLKARQLGITTAIQAWLLALSIELKNRFVVTAAHTAAATEDIFNIIRTFITYLPMEMVPRIDRYGRRMIHFAPPHGTRIQMDHANNKQMGRGRTIHFLHLSEVGFWAFPQESSTSIRQTIPSPGKTWDTAVFLESTANGYNFFRDEFYAAQNGQNDYIAIFKGWHDDPGNVITLIDNVDLGLPEDELAYLARFNALSPGQRNWWSYTWRNECYRSTAAMLQEHPGVPEDAFQSSGSPFLDRSVLSQMLATTVFDPLEVTDLRWAEISVCEECGVVEAGADHAFVCDLPVALTWAPVLIDKSGPLKIYHYPEPNRQYLIGMDVGEGAGLSNTVMQVLRIPTQEDPKPLQVAVWCSNRVKPAHAAIQAWLLAEYYNSALLVVERNKDGATVLHVLENGDRSRYPSLIPPYRNLYYDIITMNDRLLSEAGYYTSSATKPLLIGALQKAILDGDITLPDRRTIEELLGLSVDESGGVVQTAKDAETSRLLLDRFMALAIGLFFVHKTASERFFDFVGH